MAFAQPKKPPSKPPRKHAIYPASIL